MIFAENMSALLSEQTISMIQWISRLQLKCEIIRWQLFQKYCDLLFKLHKNLAVYKSHNNHGLFCQITMCNQFFIQ